jgi:hypothetical protein
MVNKDRITIAEELTLKIVAEAAPGVDVTLPAFGDKLNEFQIRSFREEPTIDDGTRRRWVQEYELDVFLSGQYEIPPIDVRFVDRRKSEDDATAKPIEGTLQTEPIPVEVTSLIEGEFDPTEFRDIKGAVPMPVAGRSRWLWWGLGAGGVVLVAAIVVGVLWLRKGKTRAALWIAPHDWAFDQLRHLIDAQLVEQGRVQEFFYRLSEITRIYVELRFGWMAAEQTTEEFLAEAQVNPVLTPEQKKLLGGFLQACDLVKFARHEPTTAEIEEAFNYARDFIEETKPIPSPQRQEAA